MTPLYQMWVRFPSPNASVEVTDAQTRLQRARDNQVISLYDHSLARLDLATATGAIGEYVNQ